jgi:hypothetical protein
VWAGGITSLSAGELIVVIGSLALVKILLFVTGGS